MKTLFIAAALLMAASAVPASAGGFTPAKADANNVCLQRQYVDGWGARNSHSMVVNDVFGHKYLLSLAGVCNDLNYSLAAGIRSFGGPGSCISRGDHVKAYGGGAFPHSTCWITKIQNYTPAMQAADRVAREKHRKLPTF